MKKDRAARHDVKTTMIYTHVLNGLLRAALLGANF